MAKKDSMILKAESFPNIYYSTEVIKVRKEILCPSILGVRGGGGHPLSASILVIF